MKKNFLFLIVLGALLLSACAESPGPELSTLPEDFFVKKAREEETNVNNREVERKLVEISEIDLTPFQRRDYILLRDVSNGFFEVSLYLNYDLICKWEPQISDPRLWGEGTTLYFAEQNCPQIGEYIVTWSVNEEIAVYSYLGETLKELQIWSLVGSQYFNLTSE